MAMLRRTPRLDAIDIAQEELGAALEATRAESPVGRSSAATVDAAPRPAQPASDTVISAGATLVGDVLGGRVVRVAGALTGEVRSGRLVVEPGGRFVGKIYAERAEIHGAVEGPIAADHVEIGSTGSVVGPIACRAMSVAIGARLDGDVSVGSDVPLGDAGAAVVPFRDGRMDGDRAPG